MLAGQTVGLLGPNGAGKTTTVAILAAYCGPDSGEVLMDGEPSRRAPLAMKRRIGLVPQDLALYDDLPARDNLRCSAPCTACAAAAGRADRNVLGLVNLVDRARDKPSTFSGGMKRRLNIAAALMHDPHS